MPKSISAEVIDLIWNCQLILGHICESKIGPNIVSDAKFNADFDVVKYFAASLLLSFAFSHLRAHIQTKIDPYNLTGFCPAHSGHFFEFKVNPNLFLMQVINLDFDFANNLTASLLLWFKFWLSQVAS